MRLHVVACCLVLGAVLPACDKPVTAPTSSAVMAATPKEQAASNKRLAESFGNEFADTSAEPQAPSYEVAIASAAADQTRGLEACKLKPPAEQKSCKDEVDSAWADASKAAESARGNQQ